jgi:hypothetical protein
LGFYQHSLVKASISYQTLAERLVDHLPSGKEVNILFV